VPGSWKIILKGLNTSSDAVVGSVLMPVVTVSQAHIYTDLHRIHNSKENEIALVCGVYICAPIDYSTNLTTKSFFLWRWLYLFLFYTIPLA
jgi:hypothetical protein